MLYIASNRLWRGEQGVGVVYERLTEFRIGQFDRPEPGSLSGTQERPPVNPGGRPTGRPSVPNPVVMQRVVHRVNRLLDLLSVVGLTEPHGNAEELFCQPDDLCWL